MLLFYHIAQRLSIDQKSPVCTVVQMYVLTIGMDKLDFRRFLWYDDPSRNKALAGTEMQIMEAENLIDTDTMNRILFLFGFLMRWIDGEPGGN